MRSRHRRRLMAQINVVPYIDVSLVLLIIFMITAPLLTRGVKIVLPQMAAKPLNQKELEKHQPIVLEVDKNGKFYLNISDKPDEAIPPGQVEAMVARVLKLSPGTPVLIKGDAGADYASVLFGMTLLQAANAPEVGLVTKPLPTSLKPNQ